nr:MFS transporter [Rhodococcus sp. 14C212]
MAIILATYFMIVFDNSIIFTGIRDIAEDLDLSAYAMSWVQNAYTAVFGGLLLLGARTGDILGRRTTLIAGLTVFALASLLVGAAQNGAWIVAARALQGVGAAFAAPSSLALVTAAVPAGKPRVRAVTAYGMMAGLGTSIGFVVGGALTHWVSWRAGFAINAPIGVALIAAALKFLPRTRAVPGRFDMTGAITSTAGMALLAYGIVQCGVSGWTSPLAFGPVAAAVVVLTVFVVNEGRAEHPIMPLRLFASGQRFIAFVVRLLFAGSMIPFFFFASQFLQDTYGWNPLQTGLALVPATVLQFATSMWTTRLTARFDNPPLILVGLALVTAGTACATQLTATSTYVVGVLVPMVFIGVGQGLTFGPLTAVGISGAPSEDAGAASGLVNTAHQLGSTLGIAALTAVSAQAIDTAERVAAAYAAGAVITAGAMAVSGLLLLPGARNAGGRSQYVDKGTVDLPHLDRALHRGPVDGRGEDAARLCSPHQERAPVPRHGGRRPAQ